jgi:hypothetical protein
VSCRRRRVVSPSSCRVVLPSSRRIAVVAMIFVVAV